MEAHVLMANLIPEDEAPLFTKALSDHFDTFKRTIVVHKEPVKIVTNTANKPYAGYGEDSEEENVTYVPQKREFDAIISYANEQTEVSSQVGVYEKGTVRIKVKEEAANYIGNGITERIDIDGKSFNKVTDDKIQTYLGIKFYIFYLEATS